MTTDLTSATRQWINELKENDVFDEIFLVKKKQIRQTKTGKDYLILELGDKTGSASAKRWDVTADQASPIVEGEYVRAAGKVETWNNQLDLKLKRLPEPLPESEVTLADFIASSVVDPQDMRQQFEAIFEEHITNKHVKLLIQAFFEDEEFMGKFCVSPAAMKHHHPFRGGLLEHTLSLAGLALKVCEHYPQLNKSLLLAGVLFHDMGKIDELTSDANITYTEFGTLVGHITGGVLLLDAKVAQIDSFPIDLHNVLRHLILSHQGLPEWGSLLPKTLEAQVLHFIDNLDAKVFQIEQAIQEDQNPDSNFTTWKLEPKRPLYKPGFDG